MTSDEDVAADKIMLSGVVRPTCDGRHRWIASLSISVVVNRSRATRVSTVLATSILRSGRLLLFGKSAFDKRGQGVDRLLGVVSVGLNDDFRSLRCSQVSKWRMLLASTRSLRQSTSIRDSNLQRRAGQHVRPAAHAIPRYSR